MENATEKTDTAELAAANIESTLNSFCSGENSGRIVGAMLTMHRTLNQKFTGEIVIPFVREMARRLETERYDLRNEAACKACAAMLKGLKAEFPHLAGDEYAGIPLI